MVTLADAEGIVRELQSRGFLAYLVGGCVRDLLLKRQPKDFDVTTNARPGQIQEVFPGSKLVGAQFGVVIVPPGIDVATFRSDSSASDGRRPERVEFVGEPRLDALRRDFTINALFQDPTTGEVLDFAGGRKDLEARWIRAIGDPAQRFQEDHLRLLRAVRFAASLGFEIEAATFDSIRALAGLAAKLAMERVAGEVSAILTGGFARRGFELLETTGLLAVILPEIQALRGGDVWDHTLKMLDGLDRTAPLTLALGVLLHDVGKPAAFDPTRRRPFDGHVEAGVAIARQLLNRLKFSQEQVAEVEALIGNHMKFYDVAHMRQSTLKRFLRMPNFERHLELHRLDALCGSGNLAHYEFARREFEKWKSTGAEASPLITGKELIAAGYTPGRTFAVMLRAVEDAQLEGEIATVDEAWAYIRDRFPPGETVERGADSE